MRAWGVALAAMMVTAMAGGVAEAADEVGGRGCGELARRVAATGSGPVFLASYDQVEDEPALNGAAFTYDNALAAIALVACGDVAHARQVGDALLLAATTDRADPHGRLRNAYRAGSPGGVPFPHGWWDDKGNHWAEDPMQVGTATGNVAWAGLALLHMARATGDHAYADGAVRLAQWAETQTWDKLWGGFSGGIHGDGADALRLGWKSTEHNVDLAALFDWLGHDDPHWRTPAKAARTFVALQFLSGEARFLTGTLPDGHTPNRATSGLDSQVWPMLLADAPEQWRRTLATVKRAHGVDGGFDFNDDRDGIWWEGTAQVALARAAAGDRAGAASLLDRLAGQFAPSGLLWATSVPRLTTGLALAPDSTDADFVYYRRPHLGATAWAILAARRWNPFIGAPLP